METENVIAFKIIHFNILSRSYQQFLILSKCYGLSIAGSFSNSIRKNRSRVSDMLPPTLTSLQHFTRRKPTLFQYFI